MDNIVIAKLIRRHSEKETEYDKILHLEYWDFIWSDGKKGSGTLYHSQLFCAIAYEARNEMFKKVITIVDSNLSREQMIRQIIKLQKKGNEADCLDF